MHILIFLVAACLLVLCVRIVSVRKHRATFPSKSKLASLFEQSKREDNIGIVLTKFWNAEVAAIIKDDFFTFESSEITGRPAVIVSENPYWLSWKDKKIYLQGYEVIGALRPGVDIIVICNDKKYVIKENQIEWMKMAVNDANSEFDDYYVDIELNGASIQRVFYREAVKEVKVTAEMTSSSKVVFSTKSGKFHTHNLGDISGFCHFSIRLNRDYGCQIDCVITDGKNVIDGMGMSVENYAIRFQPFYINTPNKPEELMPGRSLFKRGLHIAGYVTNTNVMLSCVCDYCKKSFLLRHFHAGFSGVGYFYSDSGKYTLSVSGNVPESFIPPSCPSISEIENVEGKLPTAPDGTSFKYFNSFKCPHCSEVYVDFESHREQRQLESYASYFKKSDLLKVTLD